MRVGAGPRKGEQQGAGLDANRERLTYCVLSLVGHRVTVKLRNSTYEGLFHSCALEGDHTVTLRYARQPPQGEAPSGEVISTLIIPWKDILQVSATGVQPLEQEASSSKRGGFQTDAEISAAAGTGSSRELVPWQGEGDGAAEGGLDTLAVHHDGQWDQFAANSERYGIQSTFDEELYTTKLDPNRISKEKREKAERIAKEIESGIQHADSEERCLGAEDDDEEAKFSSVPRARGSKDIAEGSSSALARFRAGGRSPTEQANLTSDNLTRHNLSRDGDNLFALEHRTKRGMITAANSSPMRPPMVSEMKRINALNLEPALPKLDDKTRSDWINFKQQQTRSPTGVGDTPGGGTATNLSLKDEFKQSLEVIQAKLGPLEKNQASSSATPSAAKASGASQPSSAAVAGAGAEVTPAGDESPSRSKFVFNPAAKAFSFNPSASVFTPTGGGAGAQAPSPVAAQASASASRPPAAPVAVDQPRFPPARQAGRACRALPEILDGVFERARGEKTEVSRPAWPEAERGIPFQEVLGKPNAQAPLGPLQGGGAAAPCQGGCMMQMGASPMGASPKFGTQMMPVMMQGGGAMQQQSSGQFAQQQPGAQPQQPPQQPQQGMMMPAGMVPSSKFGTQMVPVMMQGPQGQMMMMQPTGQMMMQPGFNAARQMGGGGGGPPNQMQGEHS